MTAATTDAQGLASVRYRLGRRSGAGNNLVEASALGVLSTAEFSASASAGAPQLIVIDSGNTQNGVVGQPLPLPLIAIVTDGNNNRLPNIPISFEVKSGGGSFAGNANYQTVSDSDGRVAATLTLGPDPGVGNNLVEVSYAGNSGYAAAFTANGMLPGPADQTRISGVVLDNSNQPIPGVTMRLLQINQGNRSNTPQEVATSVRTDEQGQFVMQPVPVGVFKLMADGGTAQRSGVWPTLEYDMITVPGQNNTVGMPVFLPELQPNNRVCVSETTGGTLTLPQAPGFALEIVPGSATFPGGSRSGCVSVTPVNMDKVPMSPGFGQQPRFIVTIQPVGTHFNPPAKMTIPNVDGLAPRAVTEMYSYDHDLAAFVAIGSATVSDDGATITSDAGSGVIKAGWHCGGNPNSSGSAGTCPTCKKCQGSDCVADDGQTPPQASPSDCKEEVCRGGNVASIDKDSEMPVEVCKQCRSGREENRPDGSTPADSNSCCFEGERLDKFGQGVGLIFDGPLLTKCPQRTQNSSRAHQVDGCSSPLPNKDNPMLNGIYFYGLLNQAPTDFGNPNSMSSAWPCNQHDYCYQTCATGNDLAATRQACDDGMSADMDAVCERAYPPTCPASLNNLQCAEYHIQRFDCFFISDQYWAALRAFGFVAAYQERQEQYCQCCR